MEVGDENKQSDMTEPSGTHILYTCKIHTWLYVYIYPLLCGSTCAEQEAKDGSSTISATVTKHSQVLSYTRHCMESVPGRLCPCYIEADVLSMLAASFVSSA